MWVYGANVPIRNAIFLLTGGPDPGTNVTGSVSRWRCCLVFGLMIMYPVIPRFFYPNIGDFICRVPLKE